MTILAFEFMYRPPSTDPRARAVFESALRSRMAAHDGVTVFLCDSDRTAAALNRMGITFAETRIVNPRPLDAPPESPFNWGGMWQRMTMTDRWARIREALKYVTSPPNPLSIWRGGVERSETGVRLDYLLMPAHDVIYSRDLLHKLIAFSQQHAANGVPAAVSPYTYYQHSPFAGVPQQIVDGVNAAFNRDPAFRLQIESGEAQGFWGKMGLIPFEICGALLQTVDTDVWEDDLEIDRAINVLGYAARALWVDDPAQYRHVLPAFDEVGVRRVIERHLHYSLRTGGSHLTQPLSGMARYQRVIDPRFGAAGAWADRLIAEEHAAMLRRVDHYGASWVDWGAYRYVARPYDPHVEVWKRVVTDISY
jgi:hypothetical protein